MDITFSYERKIQGKYFEIDLIPNGSKIDVTDKNKKEYIK